MSTKERLAKALEEAGAPEEMIRRARAGNYDDFESESATPIVDLVRDCNQVKLSAIAQRAIRGEFDGTVEEGHAWFEREGKNLKFRDGGA